MDVTLSKSGSLRPENSGQVSYNIQAFEEFKSRLSSGQVKKVNQITKQISQTERGSKFDAATFWCTVFDQQNPKSTINQTEILAMCRFLQKLNAKNTDWSEVDINMLTEMAKNILSLDPKTYKICVDEKVTHIEHINGTPIEILDSSQKIRILHINESTMASDLSRNGKWYEQLSRNWMWQALHNKNLDSVRPTGFNTPEEVKRRIVMLLNATERLDEIIDRFQTNDATAVYVLGSFLWSKDPHDIDIIVVASGMQNIMIHKLDDIDVFGLPAEVRVYGLYNLEEASKKTDSSSETIFLKNEASILYGAAVQIVGHNLDHIIAPTKSNLEASIFRFNAAIQEARNPPDGNAPNTIKINKLLYERALIEATLAEHFS